jgi:hypothetical protein
MTQLCSPRDLLYLYLYRSFSISVVPVTLSADQGPSASGPDYNSRFVDSGLIEALSLLFALRPERAATGKLGVAR